MLAWLMAVTALRQVTEIYYFLFIYYFYETPVTQRRISVNEVDHNSEGFHGALLLFAVIVYFDLYELNKTTSSLTIAICYLYVKLAYSLTKNWKDAL
jgi:hypothetical protein